MTNDIIHTLHYANKKRNICSLGRKPIHTISPNWAINANTHTEVSEVHLMHFFLHAHYFLELAISP
jgi:hypothetical protein